MLKVKIDKLQRISIEEFCERFECGVEVHESAFEGKPEYAARLNCGMYEMKTHATIEDSIAALCERLSGKSVKSVKHSGEYEGPFLVTFDGEFEEEQG